MNRTYAPRNAIVRAASDKQTAFARTLMTEAYGDNADEQWLLAVEDGVFQDSGRASRLIDFLIALRKDQRRDAARTATPAPEQDVPAPGYYAVEYGDVLRFYAVRAGKGQWAGRTFLNRYRSDYQDRVFRAEQGAVFAAILADPQAARARFAEETAHCYMCGRRLTDAVSRERGIGPDCATRA